MEAGELSVVAALVVTAACAVTDWRTGRIPNDVTGCAWVAGVLGAALLHRADPYGAAGGAVLGSVVCAIVPAVMWRAGGMGGGDVKLIAAVGAIVGPSRGLEITFAAFAFAVAFVILRRAWHGDLFATLGRAFALVNPLHRAGAKRVVHPTLSETIGFAPALLLGTVVVAAAGGWPS